MKEPASKPGVPGACGFEAAALAVIARSIPGLDPAT